MKKNLCKRVLRLGLVIFSLAALPACKNSYAPSAEILAKGSVETIILNVQTEQTRENRNFAPNIFVTTSDGIFQVKPDRDGIVKYDETDGHDRYKDARTLGAFEKGARSILHFNKEGQIVGAEISPKNKPTHAIVDKIEYPTAKGMVTLVVPAEDADINENANICVIASTRSMINDTRNGVRRRLGKVERDVTIPINEVPSREETRRALGAER